MNKTHTSILNVNISALTHSIALNKIKSWIVSNKKRYVCLAAVHLVMECQNNNQLLRGINKAAMVAPDGMPLVWLSKLYGKRKVDRVDGTRLMLRICKLAQKEGYKIFLLGGATGQSSELKQELIKKYPKITIVGNVDTPKKIIPEITNKKIIQAINKSKAQVLFIGIGCPYQELWMINNREYIDANLLIGVGAAFNFITGREKRAPVWMQNSGLEWLFRLSQNPKRLWRRYTIVNVKFCQKIISQHMKQNKL
jgi:N-acetylglucosaminyldiphosphoundecaprenol N-acetyl-beta-D-mannosaminyltransferase